MTTWSMDAAVELRALLDGLEAASDRLRAAAADDWVSPAARAYDRQLEAQDGHVRRLLADAWSARQLVLAHTNAADDWTRVGSGR